MKNSNDMTEEITISKNKLMMYQFVGFSFAMLVVFCFVFLQYMTGILKGKCYEGLIKTVSGQSAAVNNNLKECRRETDIAARHISQVIGVNADDASYIHLTREIVNDSAKGIFYVNAHGQAFLCGGNRKGIKTDGSEIYDFSERDFYIKAINGETFVSNPFAGEKTTGRVFAVSAPLIDTENNIVGAIVNFYDEKILMELFEVENIAKDNIAFIISDENNVIVKTKSFDLGVNAGEILPIENDGYISLRDFCGTFSQHEIVCGQFMYQNVDYIAVANKLEKNDWNMVVALPKSEINNGFRSLIWGIIVAAVLAEIFGLWLIRRIFRKNERYETMLEYSSKYRESSSLIYITIRRDGQIEYANQRFLKETGYSIYDIKHISIYDIVPDNYSNDLRAYIYKCSSNEDESEVEIPILVKNSKKIIHYLCFARKDEMNGVNTLQIVAMNVGRYKEYEEKMNRIVYFDSLTGLKNAVWLENHFNEYIADENNKGKIVAIIYVDLDNFKYINDRFSHDVGDKIIVKLCKRLERIKNNKATVCRRGGDEINIIVENANDRMELEDYIRDIIREIEKEFFVNGTKHNITASIGIALYPENGSTYNDIFKCADIAMNNAKENGKNTVEYFKKEMQENMVELITMESDLKDAIENNEFVLYYQPQYNIETGRLYGFEALIRWISPKKGFINPGKFISHAERTQMIVPIGDWILNEACGFANEAVEMGREDICISVNVSVIQMLCADYTDRTLEIVKRNKTNPKNIKLEITESVFMDTIDDMINKIKILNQNGLYFALDDFGTGYSSLNYLKKIPIKVLKIDKSFVDMIIDESGNKDIISSIINLAHDMNLQVVAEGIEDKVQLSWLRNRGCNIAQGYYTGKPMPKEEALKELHRNIYEGEYAVSIEPEIPQGQNFIQLS